MGVNKKRPAMEEISRRVQWTVCVHEAGHAVVGEAVGPRVKSACVYKDGSGGASRMSATPACLFVFFIDRQAGRWGNLLVRRDQAKV
jgi:hypothetical protein